MIPHSRPLLGDEEVQAVAAVTSSGMLAGGRQVEAFEQELAHTENLPYAAAVAHGTGGLHLSLLALGIGPADKVLIPSYSCVSLLNPVAYTGAQPVLVDCLPDTPDMDLRAALQMARADSRIRAAIVPFMLGRTQDVSELAQHLSVVEDATHTLGSPLPLRGQARVFSFFATKMLAGGEGGAVVTRNRELDATVRDLRSYDEREDWKPRFNCKMTDLSASILRVQLKRLPDFLARRRQLAQLYSQLPYTLPNETNYRFILLVPGSADDLMHRLQARGVNARRPVFRNLHRYLNLPDADFPHAQDFWERALSLPCYPALSDAEAERVLEVVRAET